MCDRILSQYHLRCENLEERSCNRRRKKEVGGRRLRRLSPLVLLRMTLTPHLQVHSIVLNLMRPCASAYKRVLYQMKSNYDGLGDDIYQKCTMASMSLNYLELTRINK